ncbi:MAG: hypothetical protein M9951_18060 [Burkholderiaceae bacterium]|nr:hypothetical protein [Burkholderiaceae bacterium]
MPRRERDPIATEAQLRHFVSTRSAVIAQKTLYGYLRTRIGTRYPEAFREPDFVRSIDIAKLHLFAACLSDLAIHAVAHALVDRRVDDATRRTMAMACLRAGLDDNAGSFVEGFSPAEAQNAHELRVGGVDWGRAAASSAGFESFATSPAALVRWAPIAPELKRHDVEIVENSVRFAWHEVRVDLGRRLDAGAITAELLAANT